jgi:hypothetical protein
MSQPAYVGSAARTLGAALRYLLEHDYGLVNSRRVLDALIDDIEQQVACFYPQPAYLAPGWMLYTGTRASGGKAYPGQRAGEHELVTMPWPVLLPADLERLATSSDRAQRETALQQRLVRIVEYGLQVEGGPVLLTLADLSAMLGSAIGLVGQLLQRARTETGRALPTKGYYFDQGLKPSHKAEVIAGYEQGLSEAEIARQTNHALKSVGQYLRDYRRVRLALSKGTDPSDIPLLTGMQPSVVAAYVEMVRQYHSQEGSPSPPPNL